MRHPSSMVPSFMLERLLFRCRRRPMATADFRVAFMRQDFSGALWVTSLKRGDIVVFKLPRDNESGYVKRLIGLPGVAFSCATAFVHLQWRSAVRLDASADAFLCRRDHGDADYLRAKLCPTADRSCRSTIAAATSHADNTSEYVVPDGPLFHRWVTIATTPPSRRFASKGQGRSASALMEIRDRHRSFPPLEFVGRQNRRSPARAMPAKLKKPAVRALSRVQRDWPPPCRC